MKSVAKTVPQILKDNICTVFNLLNLMIAVSLAAVGAWKNILFIFIIFINTVVGIVQEIKAKRQVERLTLLAQPTVTVLCGGKEKNISPDEIKKGDLIVLSAGSAICTDCILKEGRSEVDESVLTGESESVVKKTGDKLLSGSSIIAGRCIAEALCAADSCFASKIVDEVKKSKNSSSELLSSMNKVTKLTSFLILPLGVLLFAEAFFLRSVPVQTAVVATSAGLLGMLPKGLVLLISIGLAVGVIRLSGKNVLVRELHSLENLAHCDTVCLDKTGTLTEGSLEVDGIYPYIDEKEFQKLMATYLVYTEDNNSTYRALDKCFSKDRVYRVTDTTPFSSERKWSSVTLENGKTLVLGAPEKLCITVPEKAKALMEKGKRVLFAGLCDGTVQAEKTELAGMIVISDRLRKNAVQTIRYFYSQGVDIKVISGDNPIAAAAVARLSGIKSSDKTADASKLTDTELEKAAEECTVFGRVTPEQKKILISALQKQGHKVAMTGDGVNDLLAMRQADCSAAMGCGSDAAKQTAQLVLLNSDFSALKDVISEGRRVINNLTKSAGVFFIKTIYSVLLCVLCLLLNKDFPFIPIQITLIDAVIEAFPAFFMSFERNDRKVRGTFLSSAVRSALPNGTAIFLCSVLIFFTAPYFNIPNEQANLALYLTIGAVSLVGVVKASLPFNPLRLFLSASSVFGFFFAVTVFASLLQLPAVTFSGAMLFAVTAVFGILLAVLFEIPIRKAYRSSFAV